MQSKLLNKKKDDPYVDELLGLDKLDYLLEKSDFVVNILPFTPETKHFYKIEHF